MLDHVFYTSHEIQINPGHRPTLYLDCFVFARNHLRKFSVECTLAIKSAEIMSGYRSVHRENLGTFPIWQVATSPILSTLCNTNQTMATWRLWLACGDGVVRGYRVVEKSLDSENNSLDAAACEVIMTHVLVGRSQKNPRAKQYDRQMCNVGCSQVQVARNYVGDDDMAGDLIVVSSDLSGKIRIWVLPEDMDNDSLGVDVPSSGTPKSKIDDEDEANAASPETAREFYIENATGTCIKIMPPNTSDVGCILLAVPFLDGTIALVSTGIPTPKATEDPIEAGVIVERWSKATSSIALSVAFHPKKKTFVVGRQDGLVELFGESCHRLIQHESPVRSISFSPDGNLLVTSSDDGMICVWDYSRGVPALVQHAVQAHATWVIGLVSMFDSRRFLSCGADRQLHVWSFRQMDQALHSFTSDDVVWAIDALTTKNKLFSAKKQTQTRLISGSENGGLHIYMLQS